MPRKVFLLVSLLGVLTVAVVLAVTEVQKTTTVHTTILSNTAEVQRFTANDQQEVVANVYDGEVEIEASAPFTVLNLYVCDVEIGTDNNIVTGDTLKLVDIEIDDVPLTDLSNNAFLDVTLDDPLFSGAICVDLVDAAGWPQLSALGELDFILDETDTTNPEDDGDGMDIVAVLELPSTATASVRFAATD